MADHIGCTIELTGSVTISEVKDVFIQSGARILETGRYLSDDICLTWSPAGINSDFIKTFVFDIVKQKDRVYLVCSNIGNYSKWEISVSEDTLEIFKRIKFISQKLPTQSLEFSVLVSDVEPGEDNERVLTLSDLMGLCKTDYTNIEVCNNLFNELHWPLRFLNEELLITVNSENYKIPFCPVCGRYLTEHERDISVTTDIELLQRFVEDVIYRFKNSDDIYKVLGKPNLDLGTYNPHFFPCHGGRSKISHSLWYTNLFEEHIVNIKVFESGIITAQFAAKKSRTGMGGRF